MDGQYVGMSVVALVAYVFNFMPLITLSLQFVWCCLDSQSPSTDLALVFIYVQCIDIFLVGCTVVFTILFSHLPKYRE